MELDRKESHRSIVHKKKNQTSCFSQWWHQTFAHQKRLASLVEHPLFHVFIIIFVIGESTAVISEILLYNIKCYQQCHLIPSKRSLVKLEHGIEICRYISMSISSLFVIELFIKMYALGQHYWNCQENHKLDYLDAVIVIFTLAIEIYCVKIETNNVFAHSALLIVIFRLWHLVRIANAVARCFQKGNEFKAIRRRRRLSKLDPKSLPLIPSSIRVLLDLLQEKTDCLRMELGVGQELVDRFDKIDDLCQTAFDNYYADENLLVKELQKLHFLNTTEIKNTQNNDVVEL